MFGGDTDDLFDVFDEETTTTELPTDLKPIHAVAVAPPKSKSSSSKQDSTSIGTKRPGETDEDGDNAHVDKKSKLNGSSSVNNGASVFDEYDPIVADDFAQDVAKEFLIRDESKPSAPSGSNASDSADGKTGSTDNAEKDQDGPKMTNIQIKHNVRHQVALPPNYDYIPLSKHVPPAVPARTYPFTLDPFQRTSVSCIERGESVLVSAHTSAGKTVVAEYAIAQSLKNKQRVIYTSPIKALSNQKYRELSQEFGDVGLMTGDVTINPDSSCLVMTTEILRSMLYRGSEVIREVAWIVFDEVHYMRDKDRGVVWEETLILLPDKVHYVFLSATIPNAMQFAEWICKIHNQPCHVVYTDFRPTPLQHYLFPAGGDGIHLVVDEKSQFREDNFQKAIGSLADKDDGGAGGAGGKGGRKSGKKGGKGDKGGLGDLYKIIKMIMIKNYHPVIVFSFSKRECESNALQLSKMDFNDDNEKDMVDAVFTNAIHNLGEDDRTLPQIEHILPLLKRGIGIHHSGLLPILKEVIEILFQEGLLKVLFATETFSIGLNMPAKTVVFTSVRKFDGKETRWVSSGEYIQMSGRAGRRGLDDRGIVILMLDEKMEPAAAKGMLRGEADRLNSAFHLSYNMILNLLRVEGIDPEYMLGKSFFQFQNAAKLPQLERELKQLDEEREDIVVPKEDEISEYYEIRQQLESLKRDVRDVIHHPNFALPFLTPGRLGRVKIDPPTNSTDSTKPIPTASIDYGWGIVVNFRKVVPTPKPNENPTEALNRQPTFIVDMLLHCEPGTDSYNKNPRPCPAGVPKGEMVVVPVALSALDGLSSLRVHLPKDLKSSEQRNSMIRVLNEIQKRFADGVPFLDPVDDLNIRDEAFKKLMKKIDVLEKKLFNNPLHNAPEQADIAKVYETKLAINARIKTIKKDISQATSILQMDELKARKRVLRRLNYISASDVIEVKGRVAAEISAGDELLLTEMIFNNVFTDLSVEQTVAMLSCFAFEEKANEAPKIRSELSEPLRIMQESARRIARVSTESKLPVDEEEYVKSFRTELMDVVYAWCQGAKFSQIVKMTDVFEGSIIRSMRRLEELLRQLCNAAKSIGNVELETKFAEGIQKIKRDIVFAASLYL